MQQFICSKCTLPTKKITHIIDGKPYCGECYKIDIQGLCKKCYGKGYHSNFHGISASGDFEGEKAYDTPLRSHIYFCGCMRGRDLLNLIQQNYTLKR